MGMLLGDMTGKVGPGGGISQVRKESSRLREHVCGLGGEKIQVARAECNGEAGSV